MIEEAASSQNPATEEKLKVVMKHTNEILNWMASKVKGEREFIQVVLDMIN